MKMNDAPEKGKPIDDSMLENVTGGGTPIEDYYAGLNRYITKMIMSTDQAELISIKTEAILYNSEAQYRGTITDEIYEGNMDLILTVYKNRMYQLKTQ